MILVKLEKVNKNDTIEEKISKYEKKINYSGLKCKCGSREFDIHTGYERNVIENNQEYVITIKRVKCKQCSKTHALMPDFLIPYYQTSSKEIVECVSEMIEEGASTTKVEKERRISRQKLNQWRKRYQKLKNKIRETFSQLISIDNFLDGRKIQLVYHNVSPKFLIQVTT